MMNDSQRTDAFTAACVAVGLDPAPIPVAQGPSLELLGMYLGLSYGAKQSHFPVDELCRAKYPDKAGMEYLIPPLRWWPRVLFLRWFSDEVRGAHPAFVAHLYRPEPYNTLVRSTSTNHVYCCAIDLDFTTDEQFDRAVRLCEQVYHSPVNLQIGFGVGMRSKRMHIDFWVPDSSKPRWWRYDDLYKGPGRRRL